jgi:hypothetical protein
LNIYDFKHIVNTLNIYSVSEKAYYELLAVTFNRIYEKFSINDSIDIIYKLTLPKIDEASIFNRTQETLREFLATIMHNQGLNAEGDMDILQIQLEGIFTPKQILYLEQQYEKNIKYVQQSEALLEPLNSISSQVLIESEDQFEINKVFQASKHLEQQTFTFVKILW